MDRWSDRQGRGNVERTVTDAEELTSSAVSVKIDVTPRGSHAFAAWNGYAEYAQKEPL